MGWDYGREARDDPRVFNEGSFFQTDDGVIHMMLRSEADQLWVTESRDDGETWSEPLMTGYTDGICRPHFGRLDDGRFFGLGTPDPSNPWARTPAVLALSEDGVVFDRHFTVGDEPERPPTDAGAWQERPIRLSVPTRHGRHRVRGLLRSQGGHRRRAIPTGRPRLTGPNAPFAGRHVVYTRVIALHLACRRLRSTVSPRPTLWIAVGFT